MRKTKTKPVHILHKHVHPAITAGAVTVLLALVAMLLVRSFQLSYSSADAATEDQLKTYGGARAVYSNSKLAMDVKPLSSGSGSGDIDYEISWKNLSMPVGDMYITENRTDPTNILIKSTINPKSNDVAQVKLKLGLHYHLLFIYKLNGKSRIITSNPFYATPGSALVDGPTKTATNATGLTLVTTTAGNGYVFGSKIKSACDNGSAVDFNAVEVSGKNVPDGVSLHFYFDNQDITSDFYDNSVPTSSNSKVYMLGRTVTIKPCEEHSFDIRPSIPSKGTGFDLTLIRLLNLNSPSIKLAIGGLPKTITFTGNTSGNVNINGTTYTNTSVGSSTNSGDSGDKIYYPLFTMDKAVYGVGETPKYSVTLARPGIGLRWSSTRRYDTTGELCQSYGDKTDTSGSWTGSGKAFTKNDLGTWTKTIFYGDCQTSLYQTLTFSVVDNATTINGK